MSWKSLTYVDMLYTKMTLWPRRIFWRCSWTSIASDTDVRHADVFLASLLTPKDTWKIVLVSLWAQYLANPSFGRSPSSRLGLTCLDSKWNTARACTNTMASASFRPGACLPLLCEQYNGSIQQYITPHKPRYQLLGGLIQSSLIRKSEFNSHAHYGVIN